MQKTKLTGKETLMEAASVLADGDPEALNMFLKYILTDRYYRSSMATPEVADFFAMVDQLGLSGETLGKLYCATHENLRDTAVLFFALHVKIIDEAQINSFIKTGQLSVDGVSITNSGHSTFGRDFCKIEEKIEEKYPAARTKLTEELAQKKREALEAASPAARELYLKLKKNPELAQLAESDEDDVGPEVLLEVMLLIDKIPYSRFV
jgi:hypothetical protein